jgi:hypothetical protein
VLITASPRTVQVIAVWQSIGTAANSQYFCCAIRKL